MAIVVSGISDVFHNREELLTFFWQASIQDLSKAVQQETDNVISVSAIRKGILLTPCIEAVPPVKMMYPFNHDDFCKAVHQLEDQCDRYLNRYY